MLRQKWYWGLVLLAVATVATPTWAQTPVSTGVGWSWGYNGQGSLGDGTTTNRTRAVQISDGSSGVLAGLVMVEGGKQGASGFATAIDISGNLWSWGDDAYGQLGNGDAAFTDSLTPVSVAVVSGVVDVGAGAVHAGCLLSDGETYTWGSQQLGYLLGYSAGGYAPLNDARVYEPHQVTGGSLPAGVDISANQRHILMAAGSGDSGRVYAWGENDVYGMLGNNSQSSTMTPVKVRNTTDTGDLTGMVAVSCGDSHSMALRGSDGAVFCWGAGSCGELGNNDDESSRIPVQVVGQGGSGTLSGIEAISAGRLFSVALKDDGTVWTWGSNAHGQLGIGSTTPSTSTTPVQVHGVGDSGYLTGIVAIAAGYDHVMALDSGGTVYAWGRNYFGSIGDGDSGITTRTSPVVVTKTGGSALTNVIAIGAGYCTGYAIVGMTISSDWVDDSNSVNMDWVYQNTEVTTQDRHTTSITASVDSDGNSNSTYTVTVTEVDEYGDPVGSPVLDIDQDPSDSMTYIITGPRRDTGFYGDVNLKVAVTGDDDGGYAELFTTVTVRRLGDVDGDGSVTASDKLELLKKLNAMYTAYPDEALDLDGDGSVNAVDLNIMNCILNGMPVY